MTTRLLRWRPFGLCLLAAVLLHGLVLALLQLQRQRQVASSPASLASRPSSPDDTPELLRLSRQRSETGLPTVVPLPGFSSLPPPPPLAARPDQPAAKPASRSGRPAPRAARAPGAAQRDDKKSLAARPKVRPKDPRPASPSRAAVPGEPTSALASLEQLRRLATDPAEPRSATDLGTAAAGKGDGPRAIDTARRPGPPQPVLRRPDAATAQAIQALWDSARPASGGPAGSAGLAAGLEQRRLPLAQARSSGVVVQHGEGVLLGDQLVLFWIEADQLWLLRARVSAG